MSPPASGSASEIRLFIRPSKLGTHRRKRRRAQDHPSSTGWTNSPRVRSHAGRRDCFREWLLPGVGTIGQDVPQIPVLLPVEFVEDDRVGVRPILAAGIG